MNLSNDANALCRSDDPQHPANLIPELCRLFYTLGWVTGTGGGISIRKGDHVYIAPSGVQKERMVADDLFVLTLQDRTLLRQPPVLKPSACTPLSTMPIPCALLVPVFTLIPKCSDGHLVVLW
ncbi:unnamed protein product [Absidia cylindrospora]